METPLPLLFPRLYHLKPVPWQHSMFQVLVFAFSNSDPYFASLFIFVFVSGTCSALLLHIFKTVAMHMDREHESKDFYSYLYTVKNWLL